MKIRTKIVRLIKLGLVLALPSLAGCARIIVYEYQATSWSIEEDLALEISTFPADYGSEGFHIPFLFLESHTADHVLFQVYIRNVQDEIYNSSKGIDSCIIQAFSYQFKGEDPVILIDEDTPVKAAFWQQGEDPLPYVTDEAVEIRIRFKLNGKEHTREGTMKAKRDPGKTYPLLIDALWAT